MKFWFLTIGEPLPSDEGTPRLLRTGLLATLAASLGHEVTWWTSAFDHQAKSFRSPPGADSTAALNYRLVLLRGCGYSSNISLKRIRDHVLIAKAFLEQAALCQAPDAILCSYPTIELCEAATQYARERGIPVVLDMRDLWPDIFVNLAPRFAQPLARLALAPMRRASQRVCAAATAITGITDAFVDWGVARAGRARRPDDRAYPLAYHASLPAAQAMAAARQQWDERGLTADRPMVCFFGTLGRQFDIPMLIAAAAELRDTPLQVVVCGVGDRLDEYRQRAAKLPNVHFTGWVDAAAIRALMERSLAGLAPYHNEMSFTMSLPNKAIEYLAGGLPVVSTLRGELQRLLAQHQCGVTTPEGQPAALAAVLRGLLANPGARAKMADNAQLTYKTQFVAEAVYARLIEHLGDMAMRHQHLRVIAPPASTP